MRRLYHTLSDVDESSSGYRSSQASKNEEEKGFHGWAAKIYLFGATDNLTSKQSQVGIYVVCIFS